MNELRYKSNNNFQFHISCVILLWFGKISNFIMYFICSYVSDRGMGSRTDNHGWLDPLFPSFRCISFQHYKINASPDIHYFAIYNIYTFSLWQLLWYFFHLILYRKMLIFSIPHLFLNRVYLNHFYFPILLHYKCVLDLS